MERTIRYSGKEVTILWKPHLCIHSRKCWKELPEVFAPAERPWIHPDAASGERIVAQVQRCPSGALSIANDEPAELRMTEGRTLLELAPNGPLLVKGPVEVHHPDGRVEVKDEACALCRCGGSANKPYCDGSHRKNGFQG